MLTADRLAHLRRHAPIATAARIARAAERRLTRVCPCCERAFKVPPSCANRICCSNDCRYRFKRGDHGANAGGGAWMRGSSNPNWKDGLSHKRNRGESKAGVWRRRVLALDGLRCRRCGNESHLVAHHVRPWAVFRIGRYVTTVGVTLCRSCHEWVHSRANTSGRWIAP